MSLFEFFVATQTDVDAAQAAVNLTKSNLEKEQAALAILQKEVDPNGTTAAKVKADKEVLQKSYIDPNTAQLNDAVAQFAQQSGFARTLNDLVKPSGDQVADLQSTLNELNNKDTVLEQSARMHRRRFLDNFPQQGAGIIPHTGDNTAMVVFFVCFAVFFAAMWNLYVPNFPYKNWVAGPIAYLFIYWLVSTMFLTLFGKRETLAS